jgi:ssDNA thymidine ADP-ribosyltransferase, DarT
VSVHADDVKFRAMFLPENPYAFRLTHYENLLAILAHGVLSRNAAMRDSRFTEIGLPDLIERRTSQVVPIVPGGTLADYVPFYFTPCTPMALRILTGRGVQQRSRSELVFPLTSLDAIEQAGATYVVTDRHASLAFTKFASDRSLLASMPWELWRNRDFKRDREDADEYDRYQAEVLVHKSLPVSALRAIITADSATQAKVRQLVTASGHSVDTRVRSYWYPG